MQPGWRRSNQRICGIEGTPFVQVAVLLAAMSLLGFLTVPDQPHHSLGPFLPRVNHPVSMARADWKDAMVVAITRDNRVFFGAEAVRPADLPAKIQEEISRGSEREVYIKADARARYGWVAEVLDNVRSAGIEKIGFLVDQRRPAAPNPQ
jgi:biopolymer transport protein ExbD/biopolymer transport protein TolR